MSKSKQEQPTGDILTLQEAARFLKIPVSTAYKLAQERALPATKIGRHWRLSRRALVEFIERAGE
jgi:excisionase family DNA binding protein